MKRKILIAVLSFCLMIVSSCSGSSAKGVQGKTFVYDSCENETVKSGTSADFYGSDNPAGTDKETVISSIVKKLYAHGTSSKSDELSFSDSPVSGFNYNGNAVTVYEFNKVVIDDSNETNEGYYISLNSDYTSVRFLKSASDSFDLSDYEFVCGISAHSSTKNGVSASTIAQSSFTVNSAAYDASLKQLKLDLDVTYTLTVNDNVSSNTMSYTLIFKEQ